MLKEVYSMDDDQVQKVQGEYIQQIFGAADSNYQIIRVVLLEDTPELSMHDTLTITGAFPPLTLNTPYEFSGKVIDHPKYGIQFQAASANVLMPKEKEHIIQFLKNLKIKGIGAKTCERLYDFFGPEMLEIISRGDHHVFDGFHQARWTEEKAHTLQQAIGEQINIKNYFFDLIKLGFPMHIIMQLHEQYQDELMTIIQTNCYQLLDDFDGISLKAIDQIVFTHFSEQTTYRLRYAILYSMKQICYRTSSSCVPKALILNYLADEKIALDDEVDFNACLETLIADKKIYQTGSYYVLDYFYYTEKLIAQYLLGIQNDRLDLLEDQALLDTYITQCEGDFGIQYDIQQKAAISGAFQEAICLITGGPGTGKTTIIHAILTIFLALRQEQQYPPEIAEAAIVLLAPTGRAAKRMQHATGFKAQTIHRFLGWDLHHNTYRFNERNPIKEVECIIVDEASMIDMWLLAALLKAVPNLRQLIVVGDADQLLSVAHGQCFLDMLHSECFMTSRLSKIFRQKANSTIIDVANAINQGEHSDLYFQQSADYSFLEMQAPQMLDAIAKICVSALDKGYDITQIQVLAPMYKGIVGINAINQHLQKVFNPQSYEADEIFTKADGTVFLPQDKVLQLKNLPDVDVYNGDIGMIMSITQFSPKEYEIEIDFSGTTVVYTQNDIDLITHAYCISVHKAQGSEFPLVIMPLFFQYSIMLYRQLLYTGASRAKKALVVLGNKQAYLNAIHNDKKNIRLTCLETFLSHKNSDDPSNIQEALEMRLTGEELENITPWDFMA